MSLILFFAGSLCMGIVVAIMLLLMIVSRVEGASALGEGFVLILVSLGPLALGILLYYFAWQTSVSSSLFR